MKKLLFTLILTFTSTSTLAEWTKIGANDSKGGYTAYADLASLRKAAGKAKMWLLYDYQIVQKASGAEFLSEKIRREYDCQTKHMRKLAFSLFSWNMEGGNLIRSYSQPQKWVAIKPGTSDEVEWQTACGK